MVVNSNSHLSVSLLRQHVKCDAKHIDIKVYVVKEKFWNRIKGIEQLSKKQASSS